MSVFEQNILKCIQNVSWEGWKVLLYAAKGECMRLPYEKHMKYINIIKLKSDSLIRKQQRQ